VSAALLLALLLQRADPGLQAEFLAGPGGTALLAAAQYWGRLGSSRQDMHGFSLVDPVGLGQGKVASRLLAALQEDCNEGPAGWKPASTSSSLGQLLAWCYLVPAGGWEVEVPAGWGAAPMHPSLVTTPHHLKSLQLSMPGESAARAPVQDRCCPIQRIQIP
jgi:hypothetical protein